jgi:large subunit ribosomal protein L29
MLKANDLRERTEADLRELEKTLARDVFQNRFKNFTNRLDDTSSIRKAKKDLARVKTILAQKAAAAAPAAAEAAPAAEAPKAKAPKAKKAAAPKAETKSAEVAPKAAESKPAKKTSTKKKGEAK